MYDFYLGIKATFSKNKRQIYENWNRFHPFSTLLLTFKEPKRQFNNNLRLKHDFALGDAGTSLNFDED